MKRLAVFLVSVLASFSAQAQPTCTEIGCENGIMIQIPQVRFRGAGQYVYQFSLDRKKLITCKGSLPLLSCEKPSMSCNSKIVRITEEGCALPADEQRLGDIHIDATPKKIILKVLQDKKIIGYQEWKPSYTTAQPNTKTCAPSCRQAILQMKTH